MVKVIIEPLLMVWINNMITHLQIYQLPPWVIMTLDIYVVPPPSFYLVSSILTLNLPYLIPSYRFSQ